MIASLCNKKRVVRGCSPVEGAEASRFAGDTKNIAVSKICELLRRTKRSAEGSASTSRSAPSTTAVVKPEAAAALHPADGMYCAASACGKANRLASRKRKRANGACFQSRGTVPLCRRAGASRVPTDATPQHLRGSLKGDGEYSNHSFLPCAKARQRFNP